MWRSRLTGRYLQLSSFADPYYRLEGDLNRTSRGRVGVFINGQWGTISNTDQWEVEDVKVLCKSLGFSSGELMSDTTRSELATTGAGIVWRVDPECSGHEPDIRNCSLVKEWSRAPQQDHSHDLAISCHTDGQCRFFSVCSCLSCLLFVHTWCKKNNYFLLTDQSNWIPFYSPLITITLIIRLSLLQHHFQICVY